MDYAFGLIVHCKHLVGVIPWEKNSQDDQAFGANRVLPRPGPVSLEAIWTRRAPQKNGMAMGCLGPEKKGSWIVLSFAVMGSQALKRTGPNLKARSRGKMGGDVSLGRSV